MGWLKRIVVGHDLRAGGEVAVQSAAAFADRYHAALKLVHVVEPYHFYQKITFPPLPHAYTSEEISRRVRRELEALAASPELARLPTECEVRTGKPFVELIAACRAWQGELLVVGGTAEGEERFLGSTGERVLRKAPVPVLVAKKSLTAEAKTFLVPTDFSPCAKKAAEEALTLVRSFGGRVLFFHALDIRYIYPVAYGPEILLPPINPEDIPGEGEWQGFLFGLPFLEEVTWEKRTEEGRAAAAIVRLAEESKADLIVMGTHGRSGLAHMLLGSVAEQVVRAASCPVLTIRPDAFSFELP